MRGENKKYMYQTLNNECSYEQGATEAADGGSVAECLGRWPLFETLHPATHWI